MKAYDDIKRIDPYSKEGPLRIRGVIGDEVIPNAGKFRTGNEGVQDENGNVVFIAPPPLFLAAEDIGDLQTVQTMKRAKGRKEGRQERYRNREKDPFIGQLKQGIGVAWNRQEIGHP